MEDNDMEISPARRIVREALMIVLVAIFLGLLSSLTSTLGLVLVKKALALRG